MMIKNSLRVGSIITIERRRSTSLLRVRMIVGIMGERLEMGRNVRGGWLIGRFTIIIEVMSSSLRDRRSHRLSIGCMMWRI